MRTRFEPGAARVPRLFNVESAKLPAQDGVREKSSTSEQPIARRTAAMTDWRRVRANNVLEAIGDPQRARNERALRTYYSSVGLAHDVLSRVPEVAPFVESFLATVSVPESCREVAFRAGGLTTLLADPPVELGLSQVEALPFTAAIEDFALTDAALDRIFPGHGVDSWNLIRDDTKKHLAKNPEWVRAVLSLHARGAERRSHFYKVDNWPKLATAVSGDHPRTLRALLRLVKVMKADPSDIPFHGRLLHQHGWPRPRSVPERGELGPHRYGLGPPNRWADVLASGDHRAFKLCDDAIRLLFTKAYSTLFSFAIDFRAAENVRDKFRVMARTREIGMLTTLPLEFVRNNMIGELQQTPEDIALLRRVCRAFGMSEADFRIAGHPLNRFPRSRGLAPSRHLAPTAPLGTASTRSLRALYTKADLALFQIDDESIRNTYVDLAEILRVISTNPEWHRGVMRYCERVLDLRVTDSPEIAEKLSSNWLRHAYYESGQRDQPLVMDGLARVVRRAALNPMLILFGPKTLAEHTPFIRADKKIEGALFEENASLDLVRPLAPGRDTKLGDRRYDSRHARDCAWQDKDQGLFEIHDDSLKEFAAGVNLGTWLENWKTPRVFDFFARLAESLPDEEQWFVRNTVREHFRDRVIPEYCATEEGIAKLARLATAVAWPHHNIFIEMTSETKVIPMTSHPAYRILLDKEHQQRTESARKALENLLEPKTPAERRKEMLTKITGEPHGFTGFIRPLIEVAKELQPVAISREEADVIFDQWFHIGAIAIVAGLTTTLSSDAIAALLETKGHTPSRAREWASYAESLRSRSQQELDFLFAGMFRDPVNPEFASFSLRNTLLSSQADVERVSSRLLETDLADPVAIVRALWERGQTEPVWLSVIEELHREGVVSREHVRAANEAISLEHLPPCLFAELDSTINRWCSRQQTMSPIERGEEQHRDLDRIADLVERLWLYCDAEELMSYVLPRLYEDDLQRVLPLGELAQPESSSAVEQALAILELWGEDPNTARDARDRGDPCDFVALLLDDRRIEQLSSRALLGIAEAYALGLLPRATFDRIYRSALRSELERAALHARTPAARELVTFGRIVRPIPRLRPSVATNEIGLRRLTTPITRSPQKEKPPASDV